MFIDQFIILFVRSWRKVCSLTLMNHSIYLIETGSETSLFSTGEYQGLEIVIYSFIHLLFINSLQKNVWNISCSQGSIYINKVIFDKLNNKCSNNNLTYKIYKISWFLKHWAKLTVFCFLNFRYSIYQRTKVCLYKSPHANTFYNTLFSVSWSWFFTFIRNIYMRFWQVKHNFKNKKKYIHNQWFIQQHNIIQGFVFMQIFQKSYTLMSMFIWSPCCTLSFPWIILFGEESNACSFINSLIELPCHHFICLELAKSIYSDTNESLYLVISLDHLVGHPLEVPWPPAHPVRADLHLHHVVLRHRLWSSSKLGSVQVHN